MTKKIIVANWKMRPATVAEAEDLYRFSRDTQAAVDVGKKLEVVICPSFVYLDPLSRMAFSAALGAQNCHWEDDGAFTGEISPAMLNNIGVRYVIVGHSERRALGETDGMINAKLKAALRNGLTPILAVGEKNKGDDRRRILADQLSVDLDGVDPSGVLVAYEPVWAISTTGAGEAETPDHAREAVGIIKEIVGTVPVLYGGSVDAGNVANFVLKSEIGGVLVGGASANKEEFSNILKQAAGLSYEV